MVNVIRNRVWSTVGALAMIGLLGGSARAQQAYDYS